MKLLRDFFRLRPGRRADTRRSWTITVPAPLDEVQAQAALDMRWNADASRGRPVARWHEQAASQAHRHLQLVSSH
ncbi:hypothetical protein [Dyella sedimenti]|jgi:hypothetical protein|uniref:hypothetical protein n=1 Tax=Dyella sedimenti TaxID=2919947 RepID=UPI001FAA6055|nr:hypothetical protein [Dyella sedimenti]